MDISTSNYYGAEASKEYMSVSQYKSFLSCESRAMSELNGLWIPQKRTALLVGSYVDSYFEGSLDKFKEENPEIFKKNGELKADYIQAEEIIKRAESEPLFMEYMSGEKQVIKTGKLFGTNWKIKIDSLLRDKIVDLKVMSSMDRVMGRSFVEHWGYDLQMAIYQAIEGNHLPTYLAVITKEKPSNIEIIHIPQWRLDECLEEVEKKLPRILAVKDGEAESIRCGACDYCRATKKLTEPIDFEDVGFSNKELMMIKGEI